LAVTRIVPIVAKSDKTKDPDQPMAVIDLDEFEEDRRDVEWQAFLTKARQRRAELRLQNRIR
jgi:hypothetical protein